MKFSAVMEQVLELLRVQGLAEPNTAVMSGATYRLSEGFFACRSLGPATVKGISVPVDVYQVLEESGVQSRFEVATRTGLTPLVGREQEVGLLWERWERAKEGAGQVVLLKRGGGHWQIASGAGAQRADCHRYIKVFQPSEPRGQKSTRNILPF